LPEANGACIDTDAKHDRCNEEAFDACLAKPMAKEMSVEIHIFVFSATHF
jgi:hypothetical protein